MQKLLYIFLLVTSYIQSALAASLTSVGIDPEIKQELNFLPDVSLQSATATPEEKVFSFAGDIIITILQFAGGVAVLFIVINAAKMLLAAGEEDKITEAKTGLLWAIGGLILMILSYTIIEFVVNLGLFVEQAN